MPQRKRTDANLKAEQKYKAKIKRIEIALREDRSEDAELLEALRSQVENDSEIPSLIKQVLAEKFCKKS